MAEAGAVFDFRRILLPAGVVLVIVFAGMFLLLRSCVPVVRGGGGSITIYSNLDLKDAANVIARLKELNIPYEIKQEGKAIAIPKSRADEARLGLAEKNLPAGGVVGWEIFNESKLGATDFDRRIQLIRAISGELSRTIRRIEAVEEVRIQVVIPETRLFAAAEAPVTASIMLKLRPGFELSAEKIKGIIHLVASSVENLQPANVTVIDDTGKILTAIAPAAAPTEEAKAVAPPEIAVYPPSQEAAPVLAAEKISAEAVSTLEALTQVSTAAALTVEERILLRIRAKKEIESNLTGKAQEILNRFYPPNSVILKTDVALMNTDKTEGMGGRDYKVKKVTAVILVDNRIDLTRDLKQITYQVAAAAIGYNKKRGDQIILQKVPFHLATVVPPEVSGEMGTAFAFPKVEKPKPLFPAAWIRNLFWLAGGVAAVILALMALRMLRPRARVSEAGLSEMGRPMRAERASGIDRIKSAAEGNPEQIAELLKKWLTE